MGRKNPERIGSSDSGMERVDEELSRIHCSPLFTPAGAARLWGRPDRATARRAQIPIIRSTVVNSALSGRVSWSSTVK